MSDANHWQMQLERVNFPIVKRVRRVKRPWTRLMKKLDKKYIQFERISEDSERLMRFPNGRLKHLIKQIGELEYYLGLTIPNEGG